MVEAKPFLKFCPFCNENMSIMASWVGNDPDSLEELEAPVCPCGAQGPMYATREQAIAAWNTRPIEDALRAENERLRGGWLPIESAPADETSVDLWVVGDDGTTGWRVCDAWRQSDGPWITADADYGSPGHCLGPMNKATHWRPLPLPPEPLKGGDA